MATVSVTVLYAVLSAVPVHALNQGKLIERQRVSSVDEREMNKKDATDGH